MHEAQDDPILAAERAADAAERLAESFAEFNEREEKLYAGLICALCTGELSETERDNPDLTYTHVESWVTGPKLQGPVLRRQTGKKAHACCIRKVIDGEAPDQEPIPGLGE
jgi:hypothetical protein